jgi:hypothetical protein
LLGFSRYHAARNVRHAGFCCHSPTQKVVM